MLAFLELLGNRQGFADLAELAPRLAPGELDALRAEGFLQPTGRKDLGQKPSQMTTARTARRS